MLENGKNITLTVFPQKSKLKTFYERAHSKREVKYQCDQAESQEINYKFPSLDTMISLQTAHHIYPQQCEQGLMYNLK